MTTSERTDALRAALWGFTVVESDAVKSDEVVFVGRDEDGRLCIVGRIVDIATPPATQAGQAAQGEGGE